MKKRHIALAVLSLAGLGLYHCWRWLIARWLKLPPPGYKVRVERDMPVTMPDGVRLLADRYHPQADGDFPTILIRTPYGRSGEVGRIGRWMNDALMTLLAERGYQVLNQGARGRFGSGGEFIPHVNEAGDGHATLDWIAQQPWFDGALGTWGASYMGYMQWAAAGDAPPFLKALVPSLTSSQNFTVSHPDGAFGLESRLRWSQGIVNSAQERKPSAWESLRRSLTGQSERDLQAAFLHLPLIETDIAAAGQAIPFYRDILTHTQASDPFWQVRDHGRQALFGQIRAPVHLIGGWYDYYLRGLLADYAALKASGKPAYLTIGPWYHAHMGGLLESLRAGLAWFDAHLKGQRGRLRARSVRIYVMAAQGGDWRELDDWPPPAWITRYFLQANGEISTRPPAGDGPPDGYRYNPADPTPSLGGAHLGARLAGPQDNRALEARSDVLCYTGAPLADDLEVIGPVRLELFVRSSLAHTDFFGRLCDVYPDGRSVNVCDGLFRIEPGGGRRQPDGSLRIEVDMWATAYRFRRTHRLRLQVSSGAHPRWSRNLGTGEPLASGVRMAAADQEVYHDAARPSALALPVIAR